VFELAGECSVCGFEAFIQNKHIIGKVEEKQGAHKKYKKAVESGKRAYLRSTIFVVSILPLLSLVNIYLSRI
jgi:poly [ADP-ribose] polymerase 2/3/4